MKLYDLSQPLNQEVSFWPYYPPFEVKYIKRKAEHGVNAQYIQTSNHMGTHLDAPRHFVTAGRTIDEIPLEWLCGPGVIVDLRDEMDDLAIYTPAMIEKRVKVKEGDLLLLHTGWHRYSPVRRGARRRALHPHAPGRAPRHGAVAAQDEDPRLGRGRGVHRPPDEPPDRPVPRARACTATATGCGRGRRPSSAKERIAELFPDSAYQLTHNALFPKDCMHIENLGGQIDAPELQNRRLAARLLPLEVQGRRGGVRAGGGVRRGVVGLAGTR